MLTRFRYICILVLLSLTWIPSAQAGVQAENRVRGFDLAEQVLIGQDHELNADRHLGFQFVYDEVAVGYRLATRATGTAIVKYFPENAGFLGKTTQEVLKVGQKIDRYGGSKISRFFSPAGTPKAARALPPETANQALRSFEVVKPFSVESGTVAPAFNQLGLGTQFRTSITLEQLLKQGFIKEIF